MLQLTILVFAAVSLAVIYWIFPWLRTQVTRGNRLVEWFRHANELQDWKVRAGQQCEGAPFRLPTDGYIGFLWGDSLRPGHQHQGIDIFSGEPPGETPVIAAYAGYLSRLPDWKSSLIIRIPQDPLQPSRQIWMYYTHLADADGKSYIDLAFPPGTLEKYVEAGTFLGYQGNYSGDPFNLVGVHLHFSIVADRGVSAAYPLGGFLNELDIRNTLDPSLYLGLALNAAENRGEVVPCKNTKGD